MMKPMILQTLVQFLMMRYMLAWVLSEKSRLIASAFDGGVYVWDWRIGNLPCMKFIKKVKVSSWKDGVTSVETSIDERVIFAGNHHGYITSWDIRRGTQSSTTVRYLESLNIESKMSVTTMRQNNTMAIRSLRRDPSCPSHLAFHTNKESGLYNIYSRTVTHLHCPENEDFTDTDYLLRQAWMPRNSIYVAALPNCGVYLIDFSQRKDSVNQIILTNERLIQTNKPAISCVVHPTTDNIIAGTPVELKISP